MSHRYQLIIQGKGFSVPTDDGDGITRFTVRLLVPFPAQSLWHGTSTDLERNYD